MERTLREHALRSKRLGWAGAGLVTSGATLIYWPAGLIVAGLIVMRLAAAATAERKRIEQEAKTEEKRAKAQADREQARKDKATTCATKPAAPSA